ncbi:MAG: hypothetical protein HYX93_03290 [Chloroflexi bacterium]|nr:hypothetical protein [Chloroflexota bacterium]
MHRSTRCFYRYIVGPPFRWLNLLIGALLLVGVGAACDTGADATDAPAPTGTPAATATTASNVTPSQTAIIPPTPTPGPLLPSVAKVVD